jgi:hypothetical protein
VNNAAPRPTTVDQLVAMMTKQGLRFAPAAAGHEAAYNSLFQALRSYSARGNVASMSTGNQ